MFLGRFAIYNKYNLSHHKFMGCVANRDEIHPSGQFCHINLLDFSSYIASHQGLPHRVGDAVFRAAATM